MNHEHGKDSVWLRQRECICDTDIIWLWSSMGNQCYNISINSYYNWITTSLNIKRRFPSLPNTCTPYVVYVSWSVNIIQVRLYYFITIIATPSNSQCCFLFLFFFWTKFYFCTYQVRLYHLIIIKIFFYVSVFTSKILESHVKILLSIILPYLDNIASITHTKRYY